MARVLLGVTGGIAAYKACELARLLVRAGHEVTPILTPEAETFVSAKTFEALARKQMPRDLYPHLVEADLLVIVPLCVAFVYSRAFHSRVRQWHGQAVLVDAMGLALFTLTGVGFALHRGLPPFVASLIGVVTGTFGGVLRDVMSMEIPVIFRPGELYAVSSFAGAWVFLGAAWLGLAPVLGAALAFLAIVGLRMASVRWGVRVPDPLWLRKDEPP